jgi:hypothetical protein
MKKSFLFSLILTAFLTGCQRNPLDVDISAIHTQPLKLLRLEDELFSLHTNNIVLKTKDIKSNYGIYYEHYLMNFLNRNGTTDSLYTPSVLAFVNDKDIEETYGYIKTLYPTDKLEDIKSEADKCIKRFHYHFPKRKLPNRLITTISGWNYASAYTDSALIVSLDMYLGDTAKFYQMLRYPAYQTKKMNEHYILPDIARGWLLTEFDNAMPVNTLLNHTIFYGKLFYAVNALLPETEDSVIIGYTDKQLKTCKAFEKNYWGYFAEKNRLYENSMRTVRELTSEGPFTAAISKECPPRIAMWIGWQIVRSYMKHNKNVSLDELMNENDAQKILSKSRYRP